MSGIDTEILVVVGYSLFLLAVAACLEGIARYSHRRSERLHVAGFRYDASADLWTCPNNEKLLRAEADYGRGTIFYRAAAHACNSCAMKSRCTDSTEGRVIEHRPNSWIESELRRFHRGISLLLVGLAAVLLFAELLRHSAQSDRFVAGGSLVLIVCYGLRLSAVLAHRPANANAVDEASLKNGGLGLMFLRWRAGKRSE
jgi:hypothetical protein